MKKKNIVKHRKAGGGFLKFEIGYKRGKRSKTTGKYRRREYPDRQMRMMLAQNINKIEKYFGTTFKRTQTDAIQQVFGAGSYGVVFEMENGKVLKVTRDSTEAPNALFWMRAQRRLPFVNKATARIYKVAQKRFNKQKFGLILREAVDTRTPLSKDLIKATDKFGDAFQNFCMSVGESEKAESLDIAREAIIEVNTDAPRLADTLIYGWESGFPQYDMGGRNIGIRMRKAGKYIRPGQIVIFDFGTQYEHCWSILYQNYDGTGKRYKNRINQYSKKVKTL